MNREDYEAVQWARRLKRSRIPERFWDLTIDKLDPSPAVEAVHDYIDSLEAHRASGRGLLLAGPPGRGKTTLACVTGLHAFQRDMSAFYITLADYKSLLMDEVKLSSAISRLPREDVEEAFEEWSYTRAVLDRIKTKVVFLILDDIGKEHSTDTHFIENAFDQLIRSRYDAGLPTIITTNMNMPDMATAYSSSMASFVMEACVAVEVAGEDRRRKR